MKWPTNAGTRWHANDHVGILPPAIVNLGKIVNNLVKAYVTKSANCISIMLLNPSSERPSALPTIALSQRGVLRTFFAKIVYKAFGYL